MLQSAAKVVAICNMQNLHNAGSPQGDDEHKDLEALFSLLYPRGTRLG